MRRCRLHGGRVWMFSLRRIAIATVGLALGALICWLLFRNTDWPAVGDALRRAHPGYLAGAALCFSGTYFARAWRLRCILEVNGPARYRTAFSAMIFSVLAQMVLPVLRVPLIQSVALSRFLPRPLAQCFGATAADRMVEAAALPLFMLLVVFALPGDLIISIPAAVFSTDAPIEFSGMVFRGGLLLFGSMIGTGVIVLLLLYRYRDSLAERARRWHVGVGDGLQTFIESLHIFEDRRNLARTVLANAVLWVFFLSSVACVLTAFGVPWPWYGPFLMLTLMVLSIILPGAPGFVGQFHLAVVASVIILAPDYPPADAKALAIALHFIYVGCVFVLGVGCAFLEHLNPWKLRQAVEDAA